MTTISVEDRPRILGIIKEARGSRNRDNAQKAAKLWDLFFYRDTVQETSSSYRFRELNMTPDVLDALSTLIAIVTVDEPQRFLSKEREWLTEVGTRVGARVPSALLRSATSDPSKDALRDGVQKFKRFWRSD